MPGRIFGLDSTQAAIAAKSCAAIVVGYGLALTFEWNASYVATTIIVLQTAALGSTLNKAALRLVGTLAGAVLGVVLVALAAQDRDLFILSMALVTGVCVWAMQTSAYQYAWMLVMMTTAILGWPAAMNPLHTFQGSVDRVTAVVMGIVLSSLVHGVFWPITAGGQFERTIRELVSGCRDLVALVRRGLLEQNLDAAAIAKIEAGLASMAASLGTTLQAARGDSEPIRRHFAQYEQLCDDLQQLLLATAAIGDAGMRCARAAPTIVKPSSRELQRSLDLAVASANATIEQLSMPRDGSAAPGEVERIGPAEEAAAAESAGGQERELDAAASLLLGRTKSFIEVAAQVRSTLTGLEDPHGSKATITPGATTSPKFRVRLMKSTLAVFQVLLAAWFFVGLNWPLGLQSSMIFVMVIAFLNALLPAALVVRRIAIGLASALPVAAVFHFLIMPRIDSFVELAPWLAVLFFPFLYGIASNNPLKSVAGMVTIVLAKALISVSDAPPHYDFASFAKTYLGMSGGIGVALLLAYAFETRSPRRGMHQLLTAVLLDAARYLKQLTDPTRAAVDRAALAATHRKQSLGMIGKLKQLSAVVDYDQDPQITRGEIQTVLQACDALVARLAWAGTSGSLPNVDAARMQRANAWCAESLAAMGNALGAFQPTAIAQPGAGTLNLESAAPDAGAPADARQAWAALTAYYESLADAILECQRQLAAVDWRRWCGSHF